MEEHRDETYDCLLIAIYSIRRDLRSIKLLYREEFKILPACRNTCFLNEETRFKELGLFLSLISSDRIGTAGSILKIFVLKFRFNLLFHSVYGDSKQTHPELNYSPLPMIYSF